VEAHAVVSRTAAAGDLQVIKEKVVKRETSGKIKVII
jgi:hypothetical protein